jgi:NADPH-dependent curcumin reductase CurA
MSVTSTQVLFRRVPRGLPVPEDLEIVDRALPAPAEGEFLVRNRWLSLDPYMRMLMDPAWTFRGASLEPGQLMVGRTIAEVVQSRHPDFAPGDLMVGNFGWQTHHVCDGGGIDFRITPRDGVPLTAYLGACGSNGVTAWTGLRLIGDPAPGETVVVSAAAGSVGSAVGQLARAWGCRAVGIAGGTRKCAVVTGEFGFDACCDYKAPDLAGQLRAAAPQGVDVYFDNVGAETLDLLLTLMNPLGRIPVCGVLSTYNAQGQYYGVRNTRLVFDRRLKLQGFLQSQFRAHHATARAELEELVASGGLRYRETVAEGLESAPDAFIGMLQGRNTGKQLVKLD